jgi:hypothetical protein
VAFCLEKELSAILKFQKYVDLDSEIFLYMNRLINIFFIVTRSFHSFEQNFRCWIYFPNSKEIILHSKEIILQIVKKLFSMF